MKCKNNSFMKYTECSGGMWNRSHEATVARFGALGDRLAGFGTTEATREVIAGAVSANPWFTGTDVVSAVAAIREQMLDRDRLRAWLAAYGEPEGEPLRVAVIMAGNIPLVGFADLLYVLAAGHVPYVKPSSKDSVLMAYVIGLLRGAEPSLPVGVYGEGEEYDAVIATGSDNTGRYFRSRFAEIPAIIRGSRGSAAVLTGDETERELVLLRQDMLRYGGLGCRNVSLLFVPEACSLERLVGMLRVQRADVHPKYYNNYRSLKGKLAVSGERFVDCGSFVLTDGEEFPTELSRIVVCRYRTPEEVCQWLAAHDDKVQCVVSRDGGSVRGVRFGEAQSPALADYPDGVDVPAFLAGVSRLRNA